MYVKNINVTGKLLCGVIEKAEYISKREPNSVIQILRGPYFIFISNSITLIKNEIIIRRVSPKIRGVGRNGSANILTKIPISNFQITRNVPIDATMPNIIYLSGKK